ncbi:MAG TPA: hypothetical protein VKU44_03740 [Terriglobia bacterium]|nr:hypothetical protein [Terriglobia bacterium]
MDLRHCEREPEVIEAVRSGRWPDAAGDSLRRHVQDCTVCADAALVAGYLAQESASAVTQPALPHPGLVWWRAQIMARRDAAERAAQPIALAQRAALAVSLAVALVAALLGWPRLHGALARGLAASRAADLIASLTRGAPSTVLVMGLAACLMLAAFVLYIVWAEE